MSISIEDVKLELSSSASLRSRAYMILAIVKNKKKVYEVDSRDGFEKDDLCKMRDYFLTINHKISIG